MKYFNPADLKEFDATFNYIAKSGVGFAIIPTDEQVFISANSVNSLGLEVGDSLRVWAIDNYASPETSGFSSRWRAVRVELVTKISAAIEGKSQEIGESHRVGLEPEALTIINEILSENLPVSSVEVVRKLRDHVKPQMGGATTAQKVLLHMSLLAETGRIACLKVYGGGEAAGASAIYYAKNVNVFYEHLETPLTE